MFFYLLFSTAATRSYSEACELSFNGVVDNCMQEICRAYEVLVDPVLRHRYDAYGTLGIHNDEAVYGGSGDATGTIAPLSPLGSCPLRHAVPSPS
jgi:hypothetical protein